MPGKSLNILLFGETGVGKSSVINLIAGTEIAKTSPDVQGCTMAFQDYGFTLHSRHCRIWDTVGLEEPEMGVNGFLPAIEQAVKLIRQLFEGGGIDLLLFCVRGNRVTMTTQSNYRLFYEALCGGRVPIALVITHLEREEVMEGWWQRNEESLKNYGLNAVAGHACVTGLKSHSKHKESCQNIRNLLGQFDEEGRYKMVGDGEYHSMIKRVILRIAHLVGPSLRDRIRGAVTGEKGLEGVRLEKFLCKRCHLEVHFAHEIAESIGRIEWY